MVIRAAVGSVSVRDSAEQFGAIAVPASQLSLVSLANSCVERQAVANALSAVEA